MQDALWFDKFIWLMIAMPFLGLLVAGLSKRKDPVIKGDRVLRHDRPARISHWSHAIGVTMLLISGILLGTRFTPAFVSDSHATTFWLNVHFVFVLLFLFGTFYFLGNSIISRYRFREHLPTKRAVDYTVNHYGNLLGIKKYSMPPEEKYFESERVAFILAIVASLGVMLSGIVKALGHVFTFPEWVLNAATWVHDIFAVLMLVFFLAHVFFAAIAPFSWKTLPSMFTGYIPLDHAKEDHAAWVEELEEKGAVEPAEPEEARQRTTTASERKEGIEHV